MVSGDNAEVASKIVAKTQTCTDNSLPLTITLLHGEMFKNQTKQKVCERHGPHARTDDIALVSYDELGGTNCWLRNCFPGQSRSDYSNSSHTLPRRERCGRQSFLEGTVLNSAHVRVDPLSADTASHSRLGAITAATPLYGKVTVLCTAHIMLVIQLFVPVFVSYCSTKYLRAQVVKGQRLKGKNQSIVSSSTRLESGSQEVSQVRVLAQDI